MRYPCIFLFLASVLVTGCAHVGPLGKSAAACEDWRSIQSKPGRQWWADQRWRFASDDEARHAYELLTIDDPSPWPDWFTVGGGDGSKTLLNPGTRFQMVIGKGQTLPGRFGTFDRIRSLADVRNFLAIKTKWKSDIEGVIVYEVAEPVEVRVGPIGPQIDEMTCAFLPGRFSQFEFVAPAAEVSRSLREVSRFKLPEMGMKPPVASPRR